MAQPRHVFAPALWPVQPRRGPAGRSADGVLRPSLVRGKIVSSLGDAGTGVNGTEDKTHRAACRSSASVDSTMCRSR